MKSSDFGGAGWVRIVRSLEGHDACVPRDLPPEMDFTPGLVSTLSAADRAIGQLAGIMRTLPNPRLLIRSFIVREAVLSSRIEGTQASLQDLFLFEVFEGVEKRVPDVREVRNYVSALERGIERLRQIPISLNLIRELHRILLTEVRGAERKPGEFRRVQNWIGPPGSTPATARYVPPPPEKLAPLLHALEKYINSHSDVPLLIRIALVHYQFEAIHPFEDGNGRVGRLLISLMLDAARALPHPVLYLSAYIEEHREAYYRHLSAVSQRGEWRPWIEFVLRGVTEQAIDGVERSSLLMRLREEWARRCQEARTSALLIALVDHLFVNPYLTLASATQVLRTRPQSAQNNIKQLINLGVIREITGRRRNRIYAAQDVLSILDQRPAFDSAPRPPGAEKAPERRRKS